MSSTPFQELIKKQPTRLPVRNAHPYHMHDMIMKTPDALQRVINEELDKSIKNVAKVLVDKKKIFFIGIGTSYHACLNAKYYFRKVAKMVNTETVNSMECIFNRTLEDIPTEDRVSCAAVIFSHRGIKQYSYQSYKMAKEQGLYTVLLTSTESVITDDVDAIIRTSLPEQSSAFTVSHSTSTFCTLLLANEIAKLRSLPTVISQNDLMDIPTKHFQYVLDKSLPSIKEWCKKISNEKEIQLNYFVGYGGNESNCHEISLKIEEAAYIFAQPFQLESYIHGPFVATDNRTSVTFFISNNDPSQSFAKDRTHQCMRAVKNVNGKVTVITTECDNTTDSIVQDALIIKGPSVSEPISVLTNLFISQLMTYHLALEQKTNPDTFRTDTPLHSTTFSKAGLIL
eukprot:gene6719-8329_t